MLRYHFAFHLRYKKAAGRVHRPLQPPAHGPHRCQVHQGLSKTSGHQVGGFDVCAEKQTVAKGSYFNPLAADMARWGILIQVRSGSLSDESCRDIDGVKTVSFSTFLKHKRAHGAVQNPQDTLNRTYVRVAARNPRGSVSAESELAATRAA